MAEKPREGSRKVGLSLTEETLCLHVCNAKRLSHPPAPGRSPASPQCHSLSKVYAHISAQQPPHTHSLGSFFVCILPPEICLDDC